MKTENGVEFPREMRLVASSVQDSGTIQKATIHQLTTMLSTSKNVLFPDPIHNHLLTTGVDDPSV